MAVLPHCALYVTKGSLYTLLCLYAGERGFEISKEKLLRLAAVCTNCFNNSKNPRLLHTMAVLSKAP